MQSQNVSQAFVLLLSGHWLMQSFIVLRGTISKPFTKNSTMITTAAKPVPKNKKGNLLFFGCDGSNDLALL